MMRPPVGLLHGRQGQAGGVKGAGEVDGQNRIPFLHRKVLHRGHMLNAGVVYQNIHPAKALSGKSHHGGNFVGFAHVGTVVFDLDGTLAGRLAYGRDGAFSLTKAIEDDVGTLGGQGLGNPQANAAGGASD